MGAERKEKEAILRTLRQMQRVDLIDLYFGDESTFSMQPVLPSAFLISAIDDFCQYVEKPSVLVLDNAPAHRSQLFQEQLSRWQED